MNCPLNTCIPGAPGTPCGPSFRRSYRGAAVASACWMRESFGWFCVRHGTLNLVEFQTELTRHLYACRRAQIAVLDAGIIGAIARIASIATFKGRQISFDEGRINRKLEERSARSNQRTHGGVALMQAQVGGSIPSRLPPQRQVRRSADPPGRLPWRLSVLRHTIEGEDDSATGAVASVIIRRTILMPGPNAVPQVATAVVDSGEVCRHDVRIAPQ